MSLLTIIQDTCDLLSLNRPAAVIGSTDQQVRQLFALAVEEGDDLSSAYNWQQLMRELTFTTTATPNQDAALPDDLGRFIPNSFFNRTTRRPILGPITPQLWQAIQANPQLNRVFIAFRERDGVILYTPTPPAGQTVGCEYISVNWAVTADGATPKPRWTLDTDRSYINESLIKLGIRWRWRKSKGLPYGEDFKTYQAQRDQVAARDGVSGSIDFAGRAYATGFLPNLPEGNWPGS